MNTAESNVAATSFNKELYDSVTKSESILKPANLTNSSLSTRGQANLRFESLAAIMSTSFL